VAPLLLIILFVHIVGFLVIILATLRAPTGYEDRDGFHACADPKPDQSKAGSP
jgi:hypothetical protein